MCDELKRCWDCERILPVGEFYRNRTTGRAIPQCRACRAAKRLRYYLANKAKFLDYIRRRRARLAEQRSGRQ